MKDIKLLNGFIGKKRNVFFPHFLLSLSFDKKNDDKF